MHPLPDGHNLVEPIVAEALRTTMGGRRVDIMEARAKAVRSGPIKKDIINLVCNGGCALFFRWIDTTIRKGRQISIDNVGRTKTIAPFAVPKCC